MQLRNTGLPKGRWRWQVWENEETLKRFLAGELILPLAVGQMANGITDVGIHYVEETSFRGGTASSTWYAGLIDNASYTGDAASDTASSHTGWIEATAYSEAVRQTLSFGAAASRTISASVSFTMNATKTIQGIFVISDSTKSGTTGTLFSTALFTTPPSLTSGNVLTANYSLSD